MSIKVITYVWEHSQQKGSALLLLLAIADHAHDDGEGAYPSIDTLAAKARMSRRNAQYLLKRLEQAGELTIHYGEGPKGCNLYGIPLIAWGVQTVGGVQPIAPQGANQRIQGVQPIAPKPSLEPSLEPSSYREIEWLQTLREIPGWSTKGEPHVATLMAWVKKKTYGDDALERSAIGLSKVTSKTLAGYSNLASAFQDRLNKGYDDPNQIKERSNGNGTYRQYPAFTQRKDASNGGGSPQDIPRETSPFTKYRGT